MAGTVIVPWYATGFRADGFEEALNEIAAVALRYGASSYAVYRSKDDRYRFQQFAHFAKHIDWERYWDGPEMTDFRVRHSSWYQIPCSTAGGIAPPRAASRASRWSYRRTQRPLRRRTPNGHRAMRPTGSRATPPRPITCELRARER